MIISHGRNSFTSVINLARPVNEWTIPSYSTSKVSCSGDTFTLNGVGGWHEIAWWAFQVDKAGSYEFSYDYNIPYIKFWSRITDIWNKFALYIASNSPVGKDDDAMQYYFENAQNRLGNNIISGVTQASNLSGHMSNTLNLSAGNYWIWFPGAVADDYITPAMTFTFTNIVVKKV